MSVSKMPDGRWKVTCRYTTFDGSRKQKKKEGFQTKREAQQFEKEFLQKMNGSLSMSMSSLFDLYLEDAKARVKPTTYSSIEFTIEKSLRPAFGKTAVQDVTPLAIRKWYGELQKKKSRITGGALSQTTTTMIKSRLSSIFNFAVRLYGLPSNPCANAIAEKRKEKRREMKFLTVQEYTKFRACEQNELMRIAFDTLFWTGMREGELLALAPEDVRDGKISINKTYIKLNREEIIGVPKTASSVRVISIPRFLQDELEPLITTMSGGRIFEGASASMLRNHCKRNCVKAGVPVIRVHDLRHSHASMLIDQGVQPLLIAERLGHENVTITLRVYSHLYKAKRDDLCSVLESCYDSATQ
jgi:integrase